MSAASTNGNRLEGGWTPERLAERARQPGRPRDAPLVLVALAVGVGGSLGASAPVEPSALLAAAAVGLALWLASRVHRRDAGAAATLLVSVALVAAGWSGLAWRRLPADDLGRFARIESAPVGLEVTALAPPVFYPAHDRSPFRAIPASARSVIPVRVERLRDGDAWRAAAGRSQVTIAGDVAGVSPGDRLRVFGQLRRPRPALNPGERDPADAALAERRASVVWCVAPECVAPIDPSPRAESGGAAIESIRGRLRAALRARLTPQRSPIAEAMLLGDRSGLTRETTDAFRRAGALHVLVVSGLHMGLVAGLVMLTARVGLLPQNAALAIAAAAVVGYAALTGGAPPATRAAVAVATACLAGLTGRRVLGANALAAAGIAVFVAAPGAWHGAGTKLSFLAAATLLGVGRVAAARSSRPRSPLDRLIDRTRSAGERAARWLASWAAWLLVASLAVLVTTGPLLASEFHLLSPIAVPLSLVVLPCVWLVLIGGVGVVLGEALGGWEFLARPAASLCDLATGWLTAVVETAAATPGGAFATAGPAGWQVAVWYALAAVGVGAACWTSAWRGVVPRVGLAIVATGFAPTLAALVGETIGGRPALRCSFLAVGHGAATLLETPSGAAVLCDAGALGAPDRVADTIARALWARGVTRLDAVLVSHADVDHFNALPGLIQRIPIGAVWTTDHVFPAVLDPADRSAPAELRRVIDAAGVPVRVLRTGDRLVVGDAGDSQPVRIEVLHPSDLGVAGSDNANSLVVGVEHAGRRLLLTGDLESPGLDQLLAQEPYDCDVLVAPHHGSERSDPPGLAAWCHPELVVISSGDERPVAGSAYRRSGAAVANTHAVGFVTVDLRPGGIAGRSHRGGRIMFPR